MSSWRKATRLEIINLNERLESVYELMIGEIEILQVEEKIKKRSRNRWKRPRKTTISTSRCGHPEEMGEKDDFKNEIQELRRS